MPSDMHWIEDFVSTVRSAATALQQLRRVLYRKVSKELLRNYT